MTEFLDIEGFAGFRDTLSALTAHAAPVPTPCHRGPDIPNPVPACDPDPGPDFGLPALDGVELHPVQQRAVVDRARVRGAAPQRLPVRFPGAPHVGVSDVGERDELDGVHLDQARARPHRVPATGLDLGSFPQPERHRDLSGQHVLAQLLTEEHAPRLRPGHPPIRPASFRTWPAESVRAAIPGPMTHI
jgi:hypothetical protein